MLLNEVDRSLMEHVRGYLDIEKGICLIQHRVPWLLSLVKIGDSRDYVLAP